MLMLYGPKFVGSYFGAQNHCEEIELKCQNFAGDNALLVRCAARYTPNHCTDLKFGLERSRLAICERLSIRDESSTALDESFHLEEVEEAREVWPAGGDGQEQQQQHLVEDKTSIVERPATEERTRLEQFRVSLSRLTLTRGRIGAKSSSHKEAMISYCHGEASEQARQLKSELERLGVSTYLDLDEIKSGEDWQDSLNEAVLNCRCLVALVTPSYGETLWTSRELKLADLMGKLIIPVNFGQRWPPPSLAIQFASRQYIEWSPGDAPSSPDRDVVAQKAKWRKRLRKWTKRRSWRKRKLSRRLTMENWQAESGAAKVASKIRTSLRELARPRTEHASLSESDDMASDSALGTSGEESVESVAVGSRLGHLLCTARHRLLHRLGRGGPVGVGAEEGGGVAV